MREGSVLPALGQTCSIVSHRSRSRLSASSWNPTPVTSCTHTLAGWPALLAELQAVHCSSLPGEISSSDPRCTATRSWSAFRSITLLQSSEASTCGWPQTAAHLPPGSVLGWLGGELFYGLCRGIVHFWGTTLKAASTNSPQDTLLFSMEPDAGKHLLFSNMWSFHADHGHLLTRLLRLILTLKVALKFLFMVSLNIMMALV